MPWFIVSAQAEHNGNISLEWLIYGNTGWYCFLGGRTLYVIIPSLSKQSGAFCTYVHFWVTHRKQELTGISNIYWRILYIEVRRLFIFEVRIITQEFSKLAPPDRNNLITSVFDFLQTYLSLLIPAQQSFFSVADGLTSIGHTSTPMPKAPKVLKDFFPLCTVPVDFHIWYPGQMNFPSISGMRNIVPRPTNVR